ncbi:MAG: UDP-N-acetylglucosamine 2-epimerase (non-hydrolyzing) [Candidatus Acidiferrales bacterium]
MRASTMKRIGQKWISVVGARPHFVKLAPVCRAIEAHNAEADSPIEHVIVHTGQHYDPEVAELFFVQMAIPEPKYNLGAGSGTFGAQLGKMLEGLEPIFREEHPGHVIVYGDTNSTLAGALIASRLHLPLVHVEAGCRSYDVRMPEEQNRMVADQLSAVLFVASASAQENLHREGIGAKDDPLRRRVVFVGDVMYDALLHNMRLAQKTATGSLAIHGLETGCYYLLTIHRAENTDDPRILAGILDAVGSLGRPVVFPAHPRTRAVLEKNGFAVPPNVKQIPPAGYLEMLMFEKNARAILTDSGGVQKEAFYLGVPCVTLRDRTEWPETVALGANRAAGTSKESILAAVSAAESAKRMPGTPYGDGHAARTIVAELIRLGDGRTVRDEVRAATA